MFLCGAGVSNPAGLPGFVDLTRHVIDEVDPPQDSEIRRAFGPWIDKDSTVPGGVRLGLDHLFQLLNRGVRAGTGSENRLGAIGEG